MLVTKFQSVSGKDITIETPYITVCNGIKLSSYAKKNRARLNENVDTQFMNEARKNTSTRKHDKKAKFLEKKRLAKV